jgi:hypothetical protein
VKIPYWNLLQARELDRSEPVLPSTRHWMAWDRGDEVAERLRAFLNAGR